MFHSPDAENDIGFQKIECCSMSVGLQTQPCEVGEKSTTNLMRLVLVDVLAESPDKQVSQTGIPNRKIPTYLQLNRRIH